MCTHVTHMCTYMCTHVTHTHIHTCAHTLHTCVHTFMYRCVYTCMHTYKHMQYVSQCVYHIRDLVWKFEGRIHTIHNNTFTRETITAFMEFYYIYNTTFGSLTCREKEYSVVDRLAIIMLSRSCVTRRNYCANSNSNITSIRTLVVNITIYHIKNCYKKNRPCQDLNLESPDS